jgi:hypothetical protein
VLVDEPHEGVGLEPEHAADDRGDRDEREQADQQEDRPPLEVDVIEVHGRDLAPWATWL